MTEKEYIKKLSDFFWGRTPEGKESRKHLDKFVQEQFDLIMKTPSFSDILFPVKPEPQGEPNNDR